ncbi:MAG: hypothetical protein IT243_04445 [Bacteroidia bacterium]|nr:hypothetical protein [Bacteroidia bacterium]
MKKSYLFFLIFVCVLLIINSCKHEIPFSLFNDNNIDTTDFPCSTDTVYFQNQILPIFNTYCTGTDCHNGPKPQEDIDLTSYANIMASGKLTAHNSSKSKIYKAIIDTDPDDRMPPTANLPQEKIDLIKKWIDQGAKNNYCNDSKNPCDTSNVTYSLTIKKIIVDNCLGCHDDTYIISLTTYNKVKDAVQNRNLWNVINHFSGYKIMPPDTNFKLSDCNIRKIKIWIDAGMPEN